MKVAAPIAPYLPQTDLRSLNDGKKVIRNYD
jgi:hypothetical protein